MLMGDYYYIFDGVRVDIAATTETYSGTFKSEREDTLLMVLEDFTDTMLYAMFDVRITPPRF